MFSSIVFQSRDCYPFMSIPTASLPHVMTARVKPNGDTKFRFLMVAMKLGCSNSLIRIGCGAFGNDMNWY